MLLANSCSTVDEPVIYLAVNEPTATNVGLDHKVVDDRDPRDVLDHKPIDHVLNLDHKVVAAVVDHGTMKLDPCSSSNFRASSQPQDFNFKV